MEKRPFENSQNLLININIDVTCVGSQIGLVDPNYWIHDVGDSLENKILSHEQMHIFNITILITRWVGICDVICQDCKTLI